MLFPQFLERGINPDDSSTVDYRAKNLVITSRIKYGFQKVYRRNFLIDFYIGIGSRYIYLDHNFTGTYPERPKEWGYNFGDEFKTPGWHQAASLAFNIRLGYLVTRFPKYERPVILK